MRLCDQNALSAARNVLSCRERCMRRVLSKILQNHLKSLKHSLTPVERLLQVTLFFESSSLSLGVTTVLLYVLYGK